jgi:predicted ArsR family transcriptional regulator
LTERREELMHFMRYWFSGLLSGLEKVDEQARTMILHECGKACAESYTATVFQDAWQQSADMHAFLAELDARFPEATYKKIDPHTIQVSYSQCACDLVQCGLVQSPLICECSAYNLQENLERALETPVTVTLQASILRGEPRCLFLALLGKAH